MIVLVVVVIVLIVVVILVNTKVLTRWSSWRWALKHWWTVNAYRFDSGSYVIRRLLEVRGGVVVCFDHLGCGICAIDFDCLLTDDP